MKLEHDVYLIMYNNGRLMLSGRNGTVATFEKLSSAKGQLTKILNKGEEAKIIKITEYEIV